jgi:hypothetical protein
VSTPAPPAPDQKEKKSLSRREDYSIPCKLAGNSTLKGRICQVHIQADIVCELNLAKREIFNLIVELKEETAKRLHREWQLKHLDNERTDTEEWGRQFEELPEKDRKQFLDKAEKEIRERWGNRMVGS